MTKRLCGLTLVLGLAFSASPARADFIYMATLSGLQEVPPNASTATGLGIISYSTATQTFTYSLEFSGLTTPATVAHIHFGAFGTNGPVIFDFTPLLPKATSGSFGGTLTAANLIPRPAVGINTFADAVAAVETGKTYFNIHTSTFPGGEIRGQIPEPTGFVIAGLGVASFLGYRRLRRRKAPAA